MKRTHLMTVTAVLGLTLGLSACGSEDAADPRSGGDVGTSDEADTSDTPELSSEGDARTEEVVGRVLVNERLDVDPANAPLPDLPTHVILTSTTELADAYSTAPGIDEVVAKVEAAGVEDGERLFAYLVSACTTKDVALQTIDGDITMVVSGTAGLRCAPPTTLVVWAVGDEVAADATIGQAIQK